MVATFVLVLPSVADGAAQGWNSFYYMYGASNMANVVRVFLSFGIVIANYFCALAGLTSCSRMMFAFSRDGGLPFSKILSHVSTQLSHTYLCDLDQLCHCFAFHNLWKRFRCVIHGLRSIPLPFLCDACCGGFLCRRWNSLERKGSVQPWHVVKTNAVIAVVGGIVLAITGFFPPNEKVFYLTIAMIVIMVIIWYAFERNRFEGVPEGDKITQRQKMIAEIEKKYGEGD